MAAVVADAQSRQKFFAQSTLEADLPKEQLKANLSPLKTTQQNSVQKSGQNPGQSSREKSGLCFFDQRKPGSCKYGNSCRYEHGQPAQSREPSNGQSSEPSKRK